MDYAQKVADGLRSKGFAVFFDKLYESKMWGRDLSEYLMKVYYNQSRYCMMLISKAYVSKTWPTHERRIAIARHVESRGDYILPIRFDNSVVPGLPPTTKYIDGRARTPEDIVTLFEQKLEE